VPLVRFSVIWKLSGQGAAGPRPGMAGAAVHVKRAAARLITAAPLVPPKPRLTPLLIVTGRRSD